MKFRLRLLLAAFAVSFLLVGALSFVSIIRLSQLSSRVSAVEHSYRVANMINVLDEAVHELDKNEFRFLVTADSTYFRGYEAASLLMHKASDSLKEITSDNMIQQGFIVLFESDMTLYLAASRQTMNTRLIPVSIIHATAPYQNSKQLIGTAAKRLAQMAAEENRLLKLRTAERESYEQLTSAMIRILSIVFGLLTLVLFILLLREFRKRVLYQEELQQRMIEISQSKQELEHIAYATSHYLQEPLRKIRILTDRLQYQQKDTLTPDTHDMLARVTAAAAHMQDLVGELMILTMLSNGAKPVPCPLGTYAKSAVSLLSTRIAEQEALIEIEELPVINGYPDQLKLLFKSLLDNALKFARPGIAPDISITVRKAGSNELGQEIRTDRQYHCITIQDNGIGFDNKMADKMFGIFRQLHSGKDGYTGKGAGLAICQRIMGNHRGRIIAHGFPDAGATFKLYFPADG